MGKAIDLTGMRFGRLTVLSRSEDYISPHGQKAAKWKCACDCGNETIVMGKDLRAGKTRSCGCLQPEMVRNKLLKHGDGCHRTRLYRIWMAMRARCNNQNVPCYKNYGGRGIKVCDEWNDFAVFRDWALANGYTNDLKIDRKDNDKGYSPNNCRWATQKEQMRNFGGNANYTYQGKTLCLAEWSEITGIGYNALKQRLSAGHSFEDAIHMKGRRVHAQENKLPKPPTGS